MERLGNGLRSGDKLVKIETFIEKFNTGFGKVLGQPIYLDAALKQKLIGGLNDNLANLAQKSDEERVVEPLFILVLKNLLNRKTDDW